MNRELFRLSEDEAALVQFYRMLLPDSKAMLILTAQLQAEETQHAANNVVYLTKRTASLLK